MTKKRENLKWQKILYRRQPFPDNYSGGDEQFLNELKKNVSVVRYKYWDAVFGCSILLTHINVITLYFVLFQNTLNSNWSTKILQVLIILIIFLYFIYYKILSTQEQKPKNHIRTIISLVLFGYAFTPVIRTLTTSISTDTIYATSILTAIISCVFHNYGVKAPIVSYPTSLSSGLSSAIFLLSRLEKDTPAFLLLVVAFVLHAYGADFRNRLFAVFPHFSVVLFICIVASTICFIINFSIQLAIFWIISHIFILFICPYILILKQAGKCTIHGPWDEAVPSK